MPSIQSSQVLAGLASQAISFLTGTVLPALGVGAFSGLASTGVQKIMGNGIMVFKFKGGSLRDGDRWVKVTFGTCEWETCETWRWIVLETR